MCKSNAGKKRNISQYNRIEDTFGIEIGAKKSMMGSNNTQREIMPIS